MAFDPFLQAIITFPGRLDTFIDDGKQAYIASVGNLSSGSYPEMAGAATSFTNVSGTLVSNNQYKLRVDPGVANAIPRGFWNASEVQTQTTAFGCPTGNCTWPVYTTASVCSRCEDVTNELTTSTGYDKNPTEQTTPTNQVVFVNYTAWHLPYARLKNGHTTQWETWLTANATSDPGETIRFRDMQTLIGSFAIIKAAPEYATKDHPAKWQDTKPSATECALFFCAKALRSEVRDGKLHEQDLDSWHDRVPGSWAPLTIARERKAADAWDALVGASLARPNSLSLARSDLQLAVTRPLRTSYPQARVTLSHFNITQAAVLGTVQSLMGWTLGRTSLTAALNASAPYIVYPQSVYGTELPVASMLFASASLDATFAAVARSLSDTFRAAAAEPPQLGSQQKWIAHVRVKWAFIALPALAMLAACVYVARAIAETNSLGLPAWKEGSFASLAYGLDGGAQERLREAVAGGKGERERAAKEVKLRFDDEGDGLRLRAS